MNLSLYGFGQGRNRTWLAVDMGVAFGHEEVLPGVDAVLPDIRFLLERKAQLAGILEAKRLGEPRAPKIPVTIVKQRDRFQLGPFDIEYVPVSHSIPEPNALAIRTALGTVLHTGDWKLDAAPGLGL